MSNKQELEDLELEKKRLENEKISLEVKNLKKNSSVKIQNWDLLLKFVIAAATIISASLLKGIIDKEKAGLNSEKSILRWEIVQFEERKKVLSDSVKAMADSLIASNAEKSLLVYDVQRLRDSLRLKKDSPSFNRFIAKTLDSLLLSFTDVASIPVKFENYSKPDLFTKSFAQLVELASSTKQQYKKDGYKLVRELPFKYGLGCTTYVSKDKSYWLIVVSKKKASIGYSFAEIVGEDYGYSALPLMPENGIGGFGFTAKKTGNYSVNIHSSSDENILLIFERDSQ